MSVNTVRYRTLLGDTVTTKMVHGTDGRIVEDVTVETLVAPGPLSLAGDNERGRLWPQPTKRVELRA